MDITKLINTKLMITSKGFKELMSKVESPNPPTFSDSDKPNSAMPGNALEADSTAIISINGVLSKDVSEIDEMMLGLVDSEWVSEILSNCAEDPNINNIVLNFNSPGGITTGIEELGRKILNIDSMIKPVYAWTDNTCCSAAYWLASQARTIGMSPSAQIGGVGVYSVIVDITKQLEKDGISVFVASSGEYKLMGHEFHKLSDKEQELLNEDCRKQHEKFNQTIIQRRGDVKVEDLQGLSYEGQEALTKQLCDVLFDSMEEFLIYINSPTAMKNITKTKVATTAEVNKQEVSNTVVQVEASTPEVKTEAVVPEVKLEEVNLTVTPEVKAEVPGVPGTEAAHPEPDGDETPEGDEPEDDTDDMEECVHCKGKGKTKKVKAVEPTNTEPSATVVLPQKKMELPSTEEWRNAFGIKIKKADKETENWNEWVKTSFSGNPFN
jgi:signal peptide peptidase SppA